jgi:hypothetical protein
MWSLRSGGGDFRCWNAGALRFARATVWFCPGWGYGKGGKRKCCFPPFPQPRRRRSAELGLRCFLLQAVAGFAGFGVEPDE